MPKPIYRKAEAQDFIQGATLYHKSEYHLNPTFKPVVINRIQNDGCVRIITSTGINYSPNELYVKLN